MKTRPAGTVKLISPDMVERNPDNPRIFFRPDEMDTLMASISQYGILVPIAMSFCEFLDPSRVVAFIPSGHEERYVSQIDKQNRELFEHLNARKEVSLYYSVSQPAELFDKLESVVFGKIGNYRINIAPYGLKIFALNSFLVAARYSPRVMVWHLNPSGPFRTTPNRIASGIVNGLSMVI